MWLALAGCAPLSPSPRLAPSAYTHVYKSYDLTFYWDSTVQHNTLYLSGMMKNTYLYPLTGLELTVTLLDDHRKELGAGTFFFIPPQINVDEREPFDLTIAIPEGGTPATLKFFYGYRVPEREGYDVPYYYTFETSVNPAARPGSDKSY